MAEEFVVGQLKDHVKIPEELYGILQTNYMYAKERTVPQPPETTEGGRYNKMSYHLQFDRLVDPMIISVFYGLYVSKELPPESEDALELDKDWEFAANISVYMNIFLHLLLCLWIRKNGFPDECKGDLLKYRRDLYDFLTRTMNGKYAVSVLMPFYLNKARKAEGGFASFLYRMRESEFADCKSSETTPEYLSMEFNAAQEDFLREIVDPLDHRDKR